MDIYLQDLGLKRHVALVRVRALGMGGGNPAGVAAAAAEPRLGFLGRLWTHGSGVEPEAAAAALSAMRNQIAGLIGGMVGGGGGGFGGPAIGMAASGEPVLAAVFAAAGLGMAAAGLALPRVWFRRMHARPIAVSEIEALLPTVHDPLEREYLTLVIHAIRQEVPEEAARDVRAALSALAGAIDRLPAVSAEPVDTAALRHGAEQALARAGAETDHVMAASLERRAEALRRSAAAAEHSALLVRRSAALREEMAAQTEALRLGLTAFYTGAADTANLVNLADSVRGIASEAASVAAAREELDTAVPPPAVPAVDAEADAPRLQRQRQV